jgi:hypothetical protein
MVYDAQAETISAEDKSSVPLAGTFQPGTTTTR